LIVIRNKVNLADSVEYLLALCHVAFGTVSHCMSYIPLVNDIRS